MIYDKVRHTVLENKLIDKNDSIVVALSGGPDSVCLLHILKRLSEEMDLKVYAAHINHQIRGLDAHLDALYVSNLCEKMEIPCFIRSIDVPEYCRENKLGIEDGARKLRYEVFEEIKNRLDIDKVAIGHNQNDQAETILMRIMRGTGLHGLRGIEYKREDNIIRPILDLTRDEIERYCEENNLNPRIDSTNLEDIYSRNKIRLRILPYMRDEFNTNVIEAIVRMSANLKVDSDFIQGVVSKAYEESIKKYEDGVYIFVESIKPMHEAIKSRIVMQAIKDVAGSTNLIDKKHIEEVLKLSFDEKNGKKINLPKGLFAYRFPDYILITKKEISLENIEYEYEIEPGKDVYIPELGKTFKSKIIEKDEFDASKLGTGTQYINFDKIKGNLTLRNRHQGDKIRLQGGTKKLKDLFIGMKIPRQDRSYIPIVLNEGVVTSVCGYRINVDYKIDEDTKKILEFTLE